MIKNGWKYLTKFQKWTYSIKENLVILAEFMSLWPETNAAAERRFSIGTNFLTNEKSRMNADVLAIKIQCGKRTIRFNRKYISCSEFFNILLENDLFHSMGKYSFS